MDVVEFSALSKNNEVSLAALKAFQEILYSNSADQGDSVAEDVRNEMWMVSGKFLFVQRILKTFSENSKNSRFSVSKI